MDKFTELAASAQIASAIYGRVETGDFVVVEEPVDECVKDGLAAQGMSFCGLMAIVDGETRTMLAEELSFTAREGLAAVFVRQVTRVLSNRLAEKEREQARIDAEPPKDDSVAWLKALYELDAQ